MGWGVVYTLKSRRDFSLEIGALVGLDPTKDECKNGGWALFGFKNQGQCVRYVETAKNSR